MGPPSGRALRGRRTTSTGHTAARTCNLNEFAVFPSPEQPVPRFRVSRWHPLEWRHLAGHLGSRGRSAPAKEALREVTIGESLVGSSSVGGARLHPPGR